MKKLAAIILAVTILLSLVSCAEVEPAANEPAPDEAPAQDTTPDKDDTPAQDNTPPQDDAPAKDDTPEQDDAPGKTVSDEIVLYDVFLTETMPKIYINTEGGIAPDDDSLIVPDEKKGTMGELPVYDYVNATVTVTDCEGYELEDVEARVKVRGNYTSTYPKRPLRIKFTQKQAMCGLNDGNQFKNWVLMAEYKDPSLMRNSLVWYVMNSLFSTTGNYASDFRFVEVYLNGVYNGVYVLAEQQEVNKNRVNIPEAPDPDDYDLENLTDEQYAELHDVHFGYFIEYDGYYFNEDPSITFSILYSELTRPNGSTFTPTTGASEEQGGGNGGGGGSSMGGNDSDTRETGFTIKNDIYFEEQNEYIHKVMQTVWDVVYDACYGDHTDLAANPYHTMDAEGNYIEAPEIKTAMEAVASVVDLQSMVDVYIISEICMDNDIDWSSFYFYIDMSPEGEHKLFYTAPWDFDSSLGEMNGSNDSIYAASSDNPWLSVWYWQDWFWDLVKVRWDEAMEAGVFDGAALMIDNCADLYAEAFARNYSKWNTGSNTSRYKSQAEAAKQLKTWFMTRVESLDGIYAEKAAE